MKGYKAFDKGLVCRGKQYAENTVFEEEAAVICEKGMHFCKQPLDVLDYYPLVNGDGDIAEFAEVEALDEPVTDDGHKYCSKKLKIGAKLSFAQLIQASVEFNYEKTAEDKGTKRVSKKNFARIGSSGKYARIGSSGDSAQIGSSGNFAQIGSSGDSARIGSSGKYSVICCAGHNSKAKAKVGSWITLSEWEYSSAEGCYIPVCVKTEKVDGERIKADTWYKLIDGEFTEVAP